MTSELTRTKLHRPPVTGDLVRRPQLLKRLSQALDMPLTLISAPAGFGKTTLLSAFLESCEAPHAWLSLDDDDNDFRLFFRYVVAAIQTIHPDACEGTLVLLEARDSLPTTALSKSLINDIADIDQPFILAIDDFHYVRSENVHSTMNDLIRLAPASFHLILTGRHDPPLPLSSYRSRNQLLEVRMRDLRFSKEEITEFMGSQLQKSLDGTYVATLEERTEGWIAGLRLLAFYMRNRGGTPALSDITLIQNQYIQEYIVEEILSSLPGVFQSQLLSSSVLSRFCAPLCSALADPNTTTDVSSKQGEAFVRWIQDNNLFVYSLDSQLTWFRFHHLFKDLLYQELLRRKAPHEIRSLHQRAGIWLRENGHLGDAIVHFVAAGDEHSAIETFSKHRQGLLKRAEWLTLGRLLDLFGTDIEQRHVVLLITRAWVLMYQGRVFDMFKSLPHIEHVLAENPGDAQYTKNLSGELHVLNAYRVYNSSDQQGRIHVDGVLHHARASLKNLAPANYYPEGMARLFHSVGLHMKGDTNEAFRELHSAIGASSNPLVKSHLYLGLSYLHWIEADLTHLGEIALQLLNLGEDAGINEAVANAHHFLGIRSYQQGQYGKAEEFLDRAFELRYHTIGAIHIFTIVSLAQVALRNRQHEKMVSMLGTLSEYVNAQGNYFYVLVKRALDADLALATGKLAIAQEWAQKTEEFPLVPPSNSYQYSLVLPKVLIYEETTSARKRAQSCLAKLEKFARSINYPMFLSEALALRAILNWDLNSHDLALKQLHSSLQLAARRGVVSLYLEAGPKMRKLLEAYAREKGKAQHIDNILEAFRKADLPPTYPSLLGSSSTTTTLTARELDILRLLEQSLSNKDIAARLFISTETVKRHTKNIYRKLEVSGRSPAVAKARELGILLRPEHRNS